MSAAVECTRNVCLEGETGRTKTRGELATAAELRFAQDVPDRGGVSNTSRYSGIGNRIWYLATEGDGAGRRRRGEGGRGGGRRRV